MNIGKDKEKIPTELIDKVAISLSRLNEIFDGEFLATIIAKNGKIEIKEVVAYDERGTYEK